MAAPRPLRVGGLIPFSTVDYPGRLAAVVFCQGCPWRCAYCHNPHLQPAEAPAAGQPWPAVLDWLASRRGLLDAVVFSGGEPLLQDGLGDAMREARGLGFAIGLHTSGMRPARFAEILPRADWVGFDVKAPFERYRHVTGANGGAAVRRSLAHLLARGTPCEIRCTADESLLSPEDARRMAAQLAGLGVRRLVLQTVRGADGAARPVGEAFIAAAEEIERIELR